MQPTTNTARRTRCPITPTDRTGETHQYAIQCGHCDTLITNGMVIGGCRVHGWLCDRCQVAAEKVATP